ncbi:MAG: Lrp/AsnC ligand binding domain-containing protein [Burkholderiaceae bacterium]
MNIPTADEPTISNRIDWRILHELQLNARMSIVELAERVGLSKTPCAERVRKLEARGVLQGYQAIISPEAVGAAHIAMVQVVMARTNADSLDQFNAAVKDIPEVQCCFMIAGGFDYLMKIRTRNIQAYRQLMSEIIANLPGVQQTHSYVVMESVKDSSAVALP